ncbi:MAG: hypothetical protein II888_04910 [Clostridia bacterium]|nr:hypothetical protein [Clostridia bacterium]
MEQEQGKVKLFRERSLEAIESPESLNDYLKVTSAGVWLVMGAVILLLIGGILWSIFGRIETSKSVAVSGENGGASVYVPYDSLEAVMASGTVQVDGASYRLSDRETDAEMIVVTEEMNPFVRVAGRLQAGDVVVRIPLAESDSGLESLEGVHAGTVITESLQPISLLLQQ